MIQIKQYITLFLIVLAIMTMPTEAFVNNNYTMTKACIYSYASKIFQIIDTDGFRSCPVPTAEPRPGETIVPETFTYLYSDGNKDYFRGFTDLGLMCEVDVRTFIYSD